MSSESTAHSDQDTPLASVLALDEVGPDHYCAANAPGAGRRSYGGQFLGQTLRAAQRCVADDREVHSLHGYFLREGNSRKPTDLQVERIRDGRSFSQRCVRALQDGKEVFRSLVSFHVPESGLAYEADRMPKVPPPEEVSTTYVDFVESVVQSGKVAPFDMIQSMDIRYINAPPARSPEPVVEPQLMWMRIKERLGDDRHLHDAALVFLSDSTLIDHIALPHARRWSEPEIPGVSLDHAIWLHRPVRADEWLLFEQIADWTGGARGLSRGRIFDSAGRLVATCAQEGLFRVPDVDT